jgi:hypothetical protein
MILAIGPKGALERNFAKPSPESQSLDGLFSSILISAGLYGFILHRSIYVPTGGGRSAKSGWRDSHKSDSAQGAGR